MSPTAPSPLAAWCARIGVPFVWGPMNGGLPWPKGSGAVQRREGEWLSYVRDLYKLIPGYRASRRHARALVIGSTATWEQMPPRYRDHCVFVPENGIDPARFPDRPVPDGDRPLRVAFVGRLVEWKGCGTLIEAMAPMIGAGGATLVVIGDGPDRGRLERLAQRHRLGDGVEFRGWVDHHNVHGILGGCHVLGFPSIREFGGGVVLEAMALGVVPVVIDYGGPAELVTVDTGRKVPFGDTGAMVEGVRQALLDLASDPEGTRRMAQAAKDRVAAHFTWDRKAQQSLAIHRWVLSGGGPPPELVPVEVPLPRG